MHACIHTYIHTYMKHTKGEQLRLQFRYGDRCVCGCVSELGKELGCSFLAMYVHNSC